MQEIISQTSQETQKIGRLLGQELLKSKPRTQALVIGLEGDLGGGKTTFVQGLAQGLEIKEQITSPTFVLIKRFGNLYHIDCYRLNKPQELLELDFEEIIKDPKNLVAVEWAEKVTEILPKENLIKIEFQWLDENKRKIIICQNLS